MLPFVLSVVEGQAESAPNAGNRVTRVNNTCSQCGAGNNIDGHNSSIIVNNIVDNKYIELSRSVIVQR